MNKNPNSLPLILYLVFAVCIVGYEKLVNIDHVHADSIAIRHVQQFKTLRANVFEEAARKAGAGDFDADEKAEMSTKFVDWIAPEMEAAGNSASKNFYEAAQVITDANDKEKLSQLLTEMARAYR